MAKRLKRDFDPDGLCPCGSGRFAYGCHLNADGRLYKTVESLRPTGPVTGYSHPRY
jgi:hypothetical protein